MVHDDEPEESPIPESHLQVVDERLRRHLADPSRARPLSEFLQELAGETEGSLEERAGRVEALLGWLADTPEEIPIPESHLRLIESRWREHRADPCSAIPMEDALRMIDERLTRRPT